MASIKIGPSIKWSKQLEKNYKQLPICIDGYLRYSDRRKILSDCEATIAEITHHICRNGACNGASHIHHNLFNFIVQIIFFRSISNTIFSNILPLVARKLDGKVHILAKSVELQGLEVPGPEFKFVTHHVKIVTLPNFFFTWTHDLWQLNTKRFHNIT